VDLKDFLIMILERITFLLIGDSVLQTKILF